MHLTGIGAALACPPGSTDPSCSATPQYGPQLPCCSGAEAARNSALVGGTGPACDPNCIEAPGAQQQALIDRMQAAIQTLQEQRATDTKFGPPHETTWFPGVSNTAVILVGVGIGAILLFKANR